MSKKKNEMLVSPEDYELAVKILQEAQNDFGPLMKRHRMNLGYTLREFSLFCGIAEGRLCEYERLRRFPSKKTLHKILHGFRLIGLDKHGTSELHRAYNNSMFRVSSRTGARLRK